MNLKDYVASIENYPKEGIIFRDITPLMNNGEAYKYATEKIVEFAKNHILPYSKEIDEKQEFPVKSFEEMGKAGYFKVMIPKEYGGQGGTLEDHAAICRAFSKECATAALCYMMHNVAVMTILVNGSEELKSRKNFVEEDFIELRDSVEGLISVIEKYKDMEKDSDEYITELKEFLEEVNLTLEEKKITDSELKNLNSLGESYFNSHINSISEYGVYDKNDLEKTHKVNREITVAVNRFGKILYKITEKVMYHMI